MKCRTIFKETILTIVKMSRSFFAVLLCTVPVAVFAAKPHHITIASSSSPRCLFLGCPGI